MPTKQYVFNNIDFNSRPKNEIWISSSCVSILSLTDQNHTWFYLGTRTTALTIITLLRSKHPSCLLDAQRLSFSQYFPSSNFRYLNSSFNTFSKVIMSAPLWVCEPGPPENCHLTAKKLHKTWHFFKKNCQKFFLQFLAVKW